MKNLLIPAAAVCLLAACAATPDSASTAAPKLEEKEFRTGSRIPVRDPVSASPTKTPDPSAVNPGAPPRS